MQLDRSSWHYQIFRSMAMVAERVFPFLSFRADDRQAVDLCTYIRTITFTGPLSLSLIVGAWSYFIYVAVIWPMQRSTGEPWLDERTIYLILSVLLISFVTAHLIFALVWMVRQLEERRRQRLIEKWRRNDEPKPPRKPSFLRLLIERIKAGKAQICPILEVGERHDRT